VTGGSIPPAAGEFRPPAWLAHPHVQSIIPSLPFRRPAVERRCAALLHASSDEILDCGDGVRLLSHHATHVRLGEPPARRLAVLLHGWEGSANSLYILSLGQYLFARGFDVVRLNLRDHGDSHHLNPGIFHSCRIAEVVGAVQRLQALYPEQSLHLVGFSLGGNFCLRVAARARAAGIDLARVVAVCPVLDPEHTMARGGMGTLPPLLPLEVAPFAAQEAGGLAGDLRPDGRDAARHADRDDGAPREAVR
jgi:predicted alpha/beta-fold hydrolase